MCVCNCRSPCRCQHSIEPFYNGSRTTFRLQISNECLITNLFLCLRTRLLLLLPQGSIRHIHQQLPRGRTTYLAWKFLFLPTLLSRKRKPRRLSQSFSHLSHKQQFNLSFFLFFHFFRHDDITTELNEYLRKKIPHNTACEGTISLYPSIHENDFHEQVPPPSSKHAMRDGRQEADGPFVFSGGLPF